MLTATVEQLTGVRVDYFAVIDFSGFQAIVDAVGGIDVRVAQTTSDRGLTFAQGPNHLDGADALDATVRAVSVDGSYPTDKLADAPRDPGGHSHRSSNVRLASSLTESWY